MRILLLYDFVDVVVREDIVMAVPRPRGEFIEFTRSNDDRCGD